MDDWRVKVCDDLSGAWLEKHRNGSDLVIEYIGPGFKYILWVIGRTSVDDVRLSVQTASIRDAHELAEGIADQFWAERQGLL